MLRTTALAAMTVALLVVAGCGASHSASKSATATSTPTTTPVATMPVATAPVGPMVGSDAATMPDVVGLNLSIAAERFVGMGQGARLFTEKYHGVLASQVYGQANGIDIGDAVVTTTSPAPGSLLHGDNLFLATGPLQPRKIDGKTVGPWYFTHGPLVRRINDQGCWGCHAPEFCQRCHPGYKVGTAGMTHPPVTVESVVREEVSALYPDKGVTVNHVLVSGTNGYVVYLVYTDPASATSQERPLAEAQLARAIQDSGLRGIGTLTIVWSDSEGGVAASDNVPLP